MEQLTRPFNREQIKQRKGRKGQYYDFVPSIYVVERLNEIGTENWTFEVKDSKQIGNEVVVLGSLTILGNVKEAYGGAILDDKKTAGDTFKAAAALSLVKAASLFSIPCTFHNQQTQQQNNNYNNYQQNNQQQSNQQFACADCGSQITQAEHNYSTNNFNKPLCRNHQQQYRNKNIRRVQ